MPNVRVEAGPAAKCQARTVENSASPLCGPGILMLGLASNEGLGVMDRGETHEVHWPKYGYGGNDPCRGSAAF